VSAFRLEPAIMGQSWEDGKYHRIFQHHFLDILLEGRSLRDIVGEPEMVTPLSRPWVREVPTQVDRLLGEQVADDLPAGRVALLLCPIDGDVGCGALTASLRFSEAHVAWTDWLWESDQGAYPVEQFPDPVVFDRTTYKSQLRGALAMVQAMPYDELAHQGRRFLWPWEWGWRLPPGVQ